MLKELFFIYLFFYLACCFVGIMEKCRLLLILCIVLVLNVFFFFKNSGKKEKVQQGTEYGFGEMIVVMVLLFRFNK